MKKNETKASKPSEMGLHSKVRYQVNLRTSTRLEQKNDIVSFAMELHGFLYSRNHPDKKESNELFTCKFARFISKAFTFHDFTDEEVFLILYRAADRIRKKTGDWP